MNYKYTIFIILLVYNSAIGQKVNAEDFNNCILKVMESISHSTQKTYIIKSYITQPTKNLSAYLGESFLNEGDLTYFKSQLENPIFSNIEGFEKNNFPTIRLIKRQKVNKQVYFISLPLFTNDGNKCIVYVDSWLKVRFVKEGSGSGWLYILEKIDGKWKITSSKMNWIT